MYFVANLISSTSCDVTGIVYTISINYGNIAIEVVL